MPYNRDPASIARQIVAFRSIAQAGDYCIRAIVIPAFYFKNAFKSANVKIERKRTNDAFWLIVLAVLLIGAIIWAVSTWREPKQGARVESVAPAIEKLL